MDLAPCIGQSHSAQGGAYELDGAVGIEEEGIDACGTAFVEFRRIVVVVIEQIPLPFVLHDGMVVGPASCGRLFHDFAFERVWPHRVVAHGVGQGFRFVFHPREGEVVFPLPLESEGPFLEALREAFHRLRLRGQLRQVVFQPGHPQAAARPEDVGLAFGVEQDARVDAVHALDGLFQGSEGAFGMLAGGHADGESPPALAFGRGGEVEVIRCLR